MLGNVAGAPLAGWIFDTWNSYRGAWLCFSAMTIMAAVLAATMPSPKDNIQQSNGLVNQQISK